MTPRSLEDCTLEDAPRRCAALAMSSNNGGLWNEAPPEKPALPEHLKDYYPVAASMFSGWLTDASRAESTTESRRESAREGARGAHGHMPQDISILRIRHADQTWHSPAQWASAEWESEWDECTETLCERWEEYLEAALEEYSGDTYLILGRCDRDHEKKSIESVLGLYAARSIILDERFQTRSNSWRRAVIGSSAYAARVPVAVAEWVASAAFTSFLWCVPAEPGDPRGVLETALGLYDPSAEGPLSTLEGAVEASRLLHKQK